PAGGPARACPGGSRAPAPPPSQSGASSGSRRGDPRGRVRPTTSPRLPDPRPPASPDASGATSPARYPLRNVSGIDSARLRARLTRRSSIDYGTGNLSRIPMATPTETEPSSPPAPAGTSLTIEAIEVTPIVVPLDREYRGSYSR